MEKQQMTYAEIQKQIDLAPVGTTVLVSAREVKGGKISLEFAEKIPNLNGVNLTSILNKSDERFKSGSAVRTWEFAEPKDAQELFGFDLSKMKTEKIQTNAGKTIEVYPIGIFDPVALGSYVKLQVTESVRQPKNEWEENNLADAVKQNGQGQFLLYKGQPIFRDIKVVAGQPNHTLIQHDQIVDSVMEFGLVEEEEAVEA